MLFNKNGEIVEETMIDTEAEQYIMEAIMLDTLSNEDILMFLESQYEIDTALEESVLMEKTIVRLDKKAKLSKARKTAIFTIAKEKNDPKFKKLLTIWKMERYLEGYLDKKYGNEAMRRAKKVVAQKGSASNSAMVKKAAAAAKKQINTK